MRHNLEQSHAATVADLKRELGDAHRRSVDDIAARRAARLEHMQTEQEAAVAAKLEEQRAALEKERDGARGELAGLRGLHAAEMEKQQELDSTIRAHLARQEVSLVKPVTGGFGMNIDENCTVLSFIGEDSVARVAGVKIGTTIARIDGKKVKTRQDVVAILGPTSAGDSISFVLYTKEQLEELQKSRVQLAVQHGGQEGGGEPEPEPATTGGGSYVSRFGKQTGGSDGEDDAGDGEDDAGDGTLVAAAVKGPTYVKTGFLVMKANGSFFDSVHAELVRLTDMPV